MFSALLLVGRAWPGKQEGRWWECISLQSHVQTCPVGFYRFVTSRSGAGPPVRQLPSPWRTRTGQGSRGHKGHPEKVDDEGTNELGPAGLCWAEHPSPTSTEQHIKGSCRCCAEPREPPHSPRLSHCPQTPPWSTSLGSSRLGSSSCKFLLPGTLWCRCWQRRPT